MRTKEFEVPAEIITEFAEIIADHNLSNEINGINEDGDILIEISYEPKQKAGVMALTEAIEDYYETDEE